MADADEIAARAGIENKTIEELIDEAQPEPEMLQPTVTPNPTAQLSKDVEIPAHGRTVINMRQRGRVIE